MPHKELKGYLSVTEVLNVINKPYLLRWYGKYGNEKCEKIKKQSQSVGTRVHEEIQRRFNGLDFKTKHKNIRAMVDRFFSEFAIPYKIVPISIEPEEPLRDDRLMFQGTYDAVFEMDEKLYIADWKTSNSIDKVSVPLQLSAYAYLYNLTYNPNPKLDFGIVVRIDKKISKIEWIEYSNLEQYFQLFLSCLNLSRYIEARL